MFFAMTPEMIKNINDLKKKAPNVKAPNVKAPMSFEAYYNKRFLEECKYFIENPKFSMKYAMVMSYLQKDIREKALKEYKEKWPGSIVNQPSQSIEKNKITHQVKLVNHTHTEKSQDTESVISDYDIIDDGDVDSVQSVNSEQSVSEELHHESQPNLRRSKRLLKKSN